MRKRDTPALALSSFFAVRFEGRRARNDLSTPTGGSRLSEKQGRGCPTARRVPHMRQLKKKTLAAVVKHGDALSPFRGEPAERPPLASEVQATRADLPMRACERKTELGDRGDVERRKGKGVSEEVPPPYFF